jgi:hypothetical protein
MSVDDPVPMNLVRLMSMIIDEMEVKRRKQKAGEYQMCDKGQSDYRFYGHHHSEIFIA